MATGQHPVFDRIAAVRARRAEIHAAVVSGDLDYEGIFEVAGDDQVIASMKLLPLIESLDGVGKVQSRRALEALDLPETVFVAQVDDRARERLYALLTGVRL